MNDRADGTPAWARRAFRRLDPATLWRYPDRSRLEARLAARHGLPPDRVLATGGGDEAIHLLVARLAPGTPFILPLPNFSMYAERTRSWEKPVIRIDPGRGLRHDLDRVEGVMAAQPGAWVVLSSPVNPTGERLDRDRVLALLRRGRRTGARVFLDEAYAEFVGESLVSELPAHENLVILRTFSKAHGLAGLRVGYLLGHPPLLARFRARILPFNVSAPALAVAEAALEPAAEAEVERYCRRIRENRDALQRTLADWGVEHTPSHGSFVLLRLGSPARATALARAMAAAGIRVRTFADDPHLAGAVRIGVPLDATPVVRILARELRPERRT